MSKEQEQQLADQMFGQGTEPKPMGALEAVKEAFQAVAPGLSWDQIVGDVGHEMTEKLSQGAHELAAALFQGSGYVMYPRGTRDDHGMDGHGVHGPEQGQGEQQAAQDVQHEPQEQERGGREM